MSCLLISSSLKREEKEGQGQSFALTSCTVDCARAQMTQWTSLARREWLARKWVLHNPHSGGENLCRTSLSVNDIEPFSSRICRYVKYFKGIISRQLYLTRSTLKLYRIALHKIPGLDMKGKIRPFLRIYQGTQLIHATATKEDKESIK